jgi:hypothetical protein
MKPSVPILAFDSRVAVRSSPRGYIAGLRVGELAMSSIGQCQISPFIDPLAKLAAMR